MFHTGDTMNRPEKLARIEDIKQELLPLNSLTVSQKSVLLHEALHLCEDTGLDRAWRVFKAQLEYLQQSELAKRKATICSGCANGWCDECTPIEGVD